MKDICIIIPVYKRILTSSEKFSVDRITQVLKHREIFFVVPANMDASGEIPYAIHTYEKFVGEMKIVKQYMD